MAGEHVEMAPEIRGFAEPEDGSEQRYLARRAVRPWTAHTFWWVVHNAISRPLIAFFPVRVFFS